MCTDVARKINYVLEPLQVLNPDEIHTFAADEVRKEVIVHVADVPPRNHVHSAVVPFEAKFREVAEPNFPSVGVWRDGT